MGEKRELLQKRATIRDVAIAAGVSVSTVSNALNGRHEAMTGDTLTRIQNAIAELKYRRSNLARGLVTRNTHTIGVVMAEIDTPLFLQALNHIDPVTRTRNYNLVLCLARDEADERKALEFLFEKQVDGIIFVSTSAFRDESHLEELAAARIPVVLVNRASHHAEFDQIHWDNSAGVAAATEHLIAQGHRRIAHMVGPADRRSTDERLAGYQKALAAHGLPFDPAHLLPGDFRAPAHEWEAAAHAVLALRPRPTAVIAADDAMAAICLRVFSHAGVRVPGDLAVVGIDDQPYAAFLNPALTTVRLPIAEAGRLAAEMLLARLAGMAGPCEHKVIPCELVVRESSV
jgi:LacI family transcriptional regulator